MICDGCGQEVFRARYIEALQQWRCHSCAPKRGTPNVPGVIFPFVTTNLGTDPSKPIKVENIRQLRRLENKYGVASVALNMDSNNWSTPPRRREQSR
jgi:hypothetical protein